MIVWFVTNYLANCYMLNKKEKVMCDSVSSVRLLERTPLCQFFRDRTSCLPKTLSHTLFHSRSIYRTIKIRICHIYNGSYKKQIFI